MFGSIVVDRRKSSFSARLHRTDLALVLLHEVFWFGVPTFHRRHSVERFRKCHGKAPCACQVSPTGIPVIGVRGGGGVPVQIESPRAQR